MSEAFNATEVAVFTALNVADLTSLAEVHQHVPQDTSGSIVIIGDLDGESFGAKDPNDEDRLISLSITTQVPGEERKPVLRIQDQIETLLNGQTLTTYPGWSISIMFDGASAILFPDGQRYVGTSNFTVFALKD